MYDASSYGYDAMENCPEKQGHYRARYYDPQNGRFISEDPAGFGGGENFYDYVRNDPIDGFDSLGLAPQKKCKSPCDSAVWGFSDLFSNMARELRTKPEFLMTLAIQESGWDLSHVYETNSSSGGKPLNNLFGLTDAGGNNLQFSSVKASGDYFINGQYITTKPQTISAFVQELLDDNWNKHPNYPISILGGTYVENDPKAHIKKGDTTIGTYHSVLNWIKKCGKTLK
jgi:RHS repeat-associated protein